MTPTLGKLFSQWHCVEELNTVFSSMLIDFEFQIKNVLVLSVSVANGKATFHHASAHGGSRYMLFQDFGSITQPPVSTLNESHLIIMLVFHCFGHDVSSAHASFAIANVHGHGKCRCRTKRTPPPNSGCNGGRRK